MKCQSYSFFRGSDYFTYRSDLHFAAILSKTKRHLYDNMDDRHSACTDAQGRFTSKRGGREGWMVMALPNPPMLANQVSEDELNDPGS